MEEGGNQPVCQQDQEADVDHQAMEEALIEKQEGGESDERPGIDEVFNQMEKLKLVEEGRVVEVEDNDIDESDRDFKGSIACKILTSKYISSEVFMHFMPKIWGLEGAVKMEKAEANIYLCKFR